MPLGGCEDLFSFVFTRRVGCSVTVGADDIIWGVTPIPEFRP